MVVYKAKKSDTGAQFYQSDAQKRAVLDSNGEETKLEALDKFWRLLRPVRILTTGISK